MKFTIELDSIEDGASTIDETLHGPAIADCVRDFDERLRRLGKNGFEAGALSTDQIRQLLRSCLDDTNMIFILG